MKELYRGLSQWLGGKPSQQSLPALGGREIEVLKVLWQHGELSAQERGIQASCVKTNGYAAYRC